MVLMAIPTSLWLPDQTYHHGTLAGTSSFVFIACSISRSAERDSRLMIGATIQRKRNGMDRLNPPLDLFLARFLQILLFGVVEENPPIYTGEAAVAAKTEEERATEVEYKVAENARSINGLREAIVEGFKAMDRRFEAMERRFEAMDRRFEAMEQRFDRRLEVVDENMSRQFRWIVGIQITTLLAMIGAIGAIAAAALGR